ncbi:hypothetical protein YPPY47_2817, partial [Yersinia pestis PY-47]
MTSLSLVTLAADTGSRI